MDTQKQQIVERLKQANNILVTVKSNPTVDHLAACIGLTLALNKMGKHATAVFSGDIPSTIEFLQPEKTLEKNTDSLRDFIIALDKSKADKLRYKVEDKVVKIFITPYKTSISDKDLNFSQGDFNVDVVLALGVHQQPDLDQTIRAHGRILHDATVISVTVEAGQNLGAINWTKPTASSLSELAVEITDGLDKTMLDGQIATALLTGIVAETDRFSNNRTSPQTMSISAELMAVGANQQLVATKLAEPPLPPSPPAEKTPESAPPPRKPDDGTLEIEHEDEEVKPPQINIDEDGALHNMTVDKPELSEESAPAAPEPPQQQAKKSEAEQAGLPNLPEIPKVTPGHIEAPHMILEPPSLGGQLTAGTSSDFFDPLVDAASGAPPAQPLLDREPLGAQSDATGQNVPAAEAAASDVPAASSPPSPVIDTSTGPVSLSPPANALGEETLSDIEKQLHSPHVTDGATATVPQLPTDGASSQAVSSAAPSPDLSSARDAVSQAVGSDSSQSLAPIQALNAQPLNLALHTDAPVASDNTGASMPPGPPIAPAIIPNAAPFAPEGLTLPGVTGATESPATSVPQVPTTEPQDPNAPPPVPPPMLPPLPN